MSISKPELKNPCTKFIEIKGDTGKFYYYDKELKENVDVPLPVYFLVLDELSTVTGFNKKHKSSVYANEVKYLKKEVLRVRTFKGGEFVAGLWDDIRDAAKGIGGHFTKSVYVLMINTDSSTEFCNFKFKGSAFSAWLDKKFNPMESIVGISEFVEEQNGATTYQVPVFKPFKMETDIYEEALRYDEILQSYLKEYFLKEPEKEIAHAEAANPLTDPIDPPLENKEGKWQGGSKSKLPPTKEALVAEAKKAMEAGKTGKQYTRSMSNIEELPGANDDNPPEDELDSLPF
jgi:hypothetical protein